MPRRTIQGCRTVWIDQAGKRKDRPDGVNTRSPSGWNAEDRAPAPTARAVACRAGVRPGGGGCCGRAAGRPGCGPIERSGSVAATSPMANTPGAPATVRSGETRTKPSSSSSESGNQPVLGRTRPIAQTRRVGRGVRLSGAERDRVGGDPVEVEAGGDDGAMARVERDPALVEDARDRRPDPSVVVRERPLAREVEGDPLVGPGEGEVRRGADRSRAPADDVDRTRRPPAARAPPGARRRPRRRTGGPVGARSRW